MLLSMGPISIRIAVLVQLWIKSSTKNSNENGYMNIFSGKISG